MLASTVLFFRENIKNESIPFTDLFEEFLSAISSNTSFKQAFVAELESLLNRPGFNLAIENKGISNHTSFWQELTARIRHSLIPELKGNNLFLLRLSKIINAELDHLWIKQIHPEHITALQQRLGKVEYPIEKFATSIQILTIRTSNIGFDYRMNIRDREEKHLSLFLELQKNSGAFINAITSNTRKEETKDELRFSIEKCRMHFKDIIDASERFGANVDVIFTISKALDMLRRIEDLINICQPGNQSSAHATFSIFSSIVNAEKNSKGFSHFMKKNLKVLSLRISEHSSNTGEHYIAADFRDYSAFLGAAAGAGLIVSVLVFFKAWLHEASLPVFWEALVYSINYVLGFVLINSFHFTLATKQPAMTASTIAKSLGNNIEKANIPELGITIAKVFHTQTISFIGNLIIVFPLPFLFAWMLHWGFDYKLFGTEQSFGVMDAQHPWRSGALWFAAITGVFLFMSGLIAGYTDNRIIYSRIPERIREMKGLHRILGMKRVTKISTFLSANAGSLAGNISLGFLLGTATFIGYITGLPYDIRHITFAAGTFSAALYCSDGLFSLVDVVVTVIGILMIGAINFSVSFGLAFYTACKSRDIGLSELRELWIFLKIYIRKYPLDFIRAPLTPRKVSDILKS